jgi:hypothetical protein
LEDKVGERERLEKIQTITKYFPFWQGLIQLPLGLGVVSLALLNLWDPQSIGWIMLRLLVLLSGVALCAWATSAVARWYAQTFGMVSNPKVISPINAKSYWIAAPLAGVFMLVDIFWPLTFSLVLLLFAATLIWARQVTGGGRPYYIALAALLVPVSFARVPLGGLEMQQFVLLILGASIILIGLLDHLELTRVFKPAAREEGVS